MPGTYKSTHPRTGEEISVKIQFSDQVRIEIDGEGSYQRDSYYVSPLEFKNKVLWAYEDFIRKGGRSE